jgi:hypothetical protein
MWMNFPALYANMLCFVNALVTGHKTCTVEEPYWISREKCLKNSISAKPFQDPYKKSEMNPTIFQSIQLYLDIDELQRQTQGKRNLQWFQIN